MLLVAPARLAVSAAPPTDTHTVLPAAVVVGDTATVAAHLSAAPVAWLPSTADTAVVLCGTSVAIGAALVARSHYHEENGYILTDPAYKITSMTLDPSGAGWVVADTFKTPVTVDWIVMHHSVLVGD